jgi:cyclopropane fatty-acyl-phospholipid synthase-like methyltransferase
LRVSGGDDAKEVVERGYDVIADRYEHWMREEVEGAPTAQWLENLLVLLPPGSDVLELGCGNGEPVARALAAQHRYVGVDLSRAQLDRARALVPEATFLRADYTKLERDPASVDAVVALFTITHIPREEHRPLLDRIGSWLCPGGLFLATLGSRDNVGTIQEDFLGAPMFFSGFDTEANRQLLREAGFELVKDELVTQDEGVEGKATFLWVLARKPE